MHSAPRVCWTKASLSEWVFAVVGAGRNMLSQPEALTVVPNSGGVFGLIGARSSPQPVALEGPIAPVRSVVMFVLAIAGIVNKNITRRKNAFVLGVETSSATKSKCGLCMEVQALVFLLNAIAGVSRGLWLARMGKQESVQRTDLGSLECAHYACIYHSSRVD